MFLPARASIIVGSLFLILTCMVAGGETADTAFLNFKTKADDSVEITGYKEGLRGDLKIPATLGGRPVTSIGSSAFRDCTELTSVIVPDGVSEIGLRRFSTAPG